MNLTCACDYECKGTYGFGLDSGHWVCRWSLSTKQACSNFVTVIIWPLGRFSFHEVIITNNLGN